MRNNHGLDGLCSEANALRSDDVGWFDSWRPHLFCCLLAFVSGRGFLACLRVGARAITVED